MTAPARTASYHALRAIQSERADLPAALASTRTRLNDDRDRALTAEIVTGTLRWQRRLDHLVAHVAQRPVSKIDTDVLTVLRLSLYQLLHLDRVPDSAVVDDAVDLVRTARKSSATGFVNAVLRSTVRQRAHLPLPARPDTSDDRHGALAYLGITHSHPEWLIERWIDRYGLAACERWVQFNNETPRMTLRANTLRGTRDSLQAALTERSIETVPTRYAPHGLAVLAGAPLSQPLDGTFLVQDEASQLVPLAVGVRPGDRVLDLCASPGGKTTAMAADMRATGHIVACDVRPNRVALLEETVRLSGATGVEIVRVLDSGPLPFTEPFNRVLVDAPCSGLGTIRRDPDIRWRRSESDLAAFSREQSRLLARVAPLVVPSGRLVYATCSSEPEENEAVVDAFLRTAPDFMLCDLRNEVAAPLSDLIDRRGMLRTLPSEHQLDAFFAAVLIRR